MSARSVMVRYRLKPDRVEENVQLVQAVFAELERTRPPGLRYATFRAGLEFVHVAEIDTPDGANPLLALAPFRRFTAAIRERCEQPPETHDVDRVGGYRIFVE
jgi:hypothetical protein